MQVKEILHKEIESLSDVSAGEILDYVQFVKNKYKNSKNASALLSEKSLGKDWLRAEEDEAWGNL